MQNILLIYEHFEDVCLKCIPAHVDVLIYKYAPTLHVGLLSEVNCIEQTCS